MILNYYVAGNIGDAQIWHNFWYLGINVNCHEWQLPLVTTNVDTQILYGDV